MAVKAIMNGPVNQSKKPQKKIDKSFNYRVTKPLAQFLHGGATFFL
jgi:hypothetical protein